MHYAILTHYVAQVVERARREDLDQPLTYPVRFVRNRQAQPVIDRQFNTGAITMHLLITNFCALTYREAMSSSSNSCDGQRTCAVQLLDVYMGAAAVPSDAVVWDMNNPNDLQVHLPSAQRPPLHVIAATESLTACAIRPSSCVPKDKRSSLTQRGLRTPGCRSCSVLPLGLIGCHVSAGGLDVTTRVVRRSEQRMDDNRLDTSEYFRYTIVLATLSMQHPLPTAHLTPEVSMRRQIYEVPGRPEPKVKASQCFTKYRC